MIPKHVKFDSVAKSSMKRLVEYITADQDKVHRVGEIMISNCQHDVPELALREMMMVQAMNRRAKSDKTYHLLLSFPSGEEPAPETLRRIETGVCAKLGFAEHQRIAVIHRDTDNLHLHIAINKIHPTRFTLHDPHKAYPALAEICNELEKSYFLRHDNHTPTGKTRGERQAGDMEAMTGQESLLSWIRRECLQNLKATDSWETLHNELAKSGLTLALRGNGVVIADASGAMVKGSDIDRAFSKTNLEKRLGVFQPKGKSSLPKQEKAYSKAPLGSATPLKAEFEKYRSDYERLKNTALTEAREAYQRKLAKLHEENQAERQKAKQLPAGRLVKRKLFSALREKYAFRRTQLRIASPKERKERLQSIPRHTWLSWLQAQARVGRTEAVQALRARAFGLARKVGTAITGIKSDTSGQFVGQTADTITKRGTVIYDVGGDALRDDGAALRLSKAAGLETAAMALRIAKQRFGEPLRLEGDRTFREQMVAAAIQGKVDVRFADVKLEAMRQNLLQQHNHPTKQQRAENERT